MNTALQRTTEDESKLAEEIKQFVAFRLGEEDYAVDILEVQEIIRFEEVTWLPRKPSYVLGIINLRGEILPIISMRTKFGLKSSAPDRHSRILILKITDRLIGFLVDTVHEVLDLLPNEIDREPDVLNSDRKMIQYVEAIATRADRIYVILNVAKILTKDEQEVVTSGA